VLLKPGLNRRATLLAQVDVVGLISSYVGVAIDDYLTACLIDQLEHLIAAMQILTNARVAKLVSRRGERGSECHTNAVSKFSQHVNMRHQF
jgi:hypothetical protein